MSNAKNVLKTSLRSAIHATDSMCNGCKANSAATNALRQIVAVNFQNSRKSSAALAAWKSRFVKCGPAALGPDNSASSIRDSHVSGCQLLAWPDVNAQTTFADVRPDETCGLDVK